VDISEFPSAGVQRDSGILEIRLKVKNFSFS
jgi:hypothetical protein